MRAMFTFLVTQSLKNRLLVCALSGVLILLGLAMVTGLWTEWMVRLQSWFQNEWVMPL